MRHFRYLSSVVTLKLDREACIGCGLCLMVCPHAVFALQEGKAVITDLDGCMECGACSLNCPVKAISVDSGVGCASGMINQWLASFNIKFQKNSGCC